MKSITKLIHKVIHKARHSFFLFGLASILWLIFHTGSKPTRMSYPCQQASAASGSLWITAYVLPFILAAASPGRWVERRAKALAGFLLLLFISLIFAAAGTTGNDDAVTRLMEAMNSHGPPFYAQNGSIGIVEKDDVVIIKVNSQWNERGGTNSDLVKLLVQAILNHPQGFAGEVIIADNGQGQYGSTGCGGSLSYARNNAKDKAQSMQVVADSFPDQKVSTYLWDRRTNEKVGEYADGDMADGYILSGPPDAQTKIAVTYPKFQTKYGTLMSRVKLISISLQVNDHGESNDRQKSRRDRPFHRHGGPGKSARDGTPGNRSHPSGGGRAGL